MWQCVYCSHPNDDPSAPCEVCGSLPEQDANVPAAVSVEHANVPAAVPVQDAGVLRVDYSAVPSLREPAADLAGGWSVATPSGIEASDPAAEVYGSAADQHGYPSSASQGWPERPRVTAPFIVDRGPRPWYRHAGVTAAIALVVLAVAVTGVLVAPRLLRSRAVETRAMASRTAPVTPVPTDGAQQGPGSDLTDSPVVTETSPSAEPTAIGVVAVAPTVTDGRAGDIAAMFDTYFSGINGKNYANVGSVLDPNGPIDPGNPKQMNGFARGTRSTQDSNVSLISIADTGNGALSVEVTFQSTQSPGDGPKGRTSETCTRWDVVYTVTMTSGYRISGSRATSMTC